MIVFKDYNEKADILKAMELNMNEEFRATMQYICHRITAHSIDSLIADSFKSAGLDEMSHILFFSDIITKNGGIPKFYEWDIAKSQDLKTMLEKNIELEKSARLRYAEQIDKFKHHEELVSLLKTVLLDEEDHEDTFRQYLEKL